MAYSQLTQLSLPLSQVIANDAPILSPLSPAMSDNQWDDNNFTFYSHIPSPAPSLSSASSPIQHQSVLKSRMTPDSHACIPTHQLFDLKSPPSPSPSLPSSTRNTSVPPNSHSSASTHKRSASPDPPSNKKPRAQGERISSKDFIPPDVSGLTKREARLVKNRAAAFLSRQRKREEFELMEKRVTDLEKENARLLTLAQGNADSSLVSEVEQLKAELAAAKDRERDLSAQLASRTAASSHQEAPVKVEASDSNFSLSSNARSSNVPSSNKTGASIGLMVLLCALPSLLSMPMQSASTSFTIPTPLPPTTAFDLNNYLPNDYDWSRSGASIMDLDIDDQHRKLSTAPTVRKLEFSSDADAEDVGALGNLDISFDTTPTDGKIRVRIHPSSSVSSRATSPGASSTSSTWESDPIRTDGSYAAPSPSSLSSSSLSNAISPTLNSDPFFGVGGSSDFGSVLDGNLGMFYGSSQLDDLSGLGYPLQSDSSMGFGLGGNEFSVPDQTQKRRVRISLKSMPQSGGAEGGEWEVQVC